MHHQRTSEICFDETYHVAAHETARALFSRLPHDGAIATSLIDCLATAYLVAIAESICIREMQRHVDDAVEVLVGRTVRVEHRAPTLPGTTLRMSGWVESLGERSATFCVQVWDGMEVVSEATVTLVSVRRPSIEARIASKVNSKSVVSNADSSRTLSQHAMATSDETPPMD